MLLVQKYLETKSFAELVKEHGVYASFSKSGHKFSLNYDQIEARESDPLAQECRGLILSYEDGKPREAMDNGSGKLIWDKIIPGKTKILAFPMKRFFNYGQGAAVQIDWSDPNLTILEKLDGTLCIVYFDTFSKQWCVATRSVPEADLLMDNSLFTFRTLFEKAVRETSGLDFNGFTNKLDQNYTYCFELTTPYNRIVVDYKSCGVTLLAIREMTTLLETDPNRCMLVKAGHVPSVYAYAPSGAEELLNWVSSLNPIEHEGVVVRDTNFNRIKVKNAAYVAYNKLHDRLGSSERNCMEFVLLERDDDVSPFLPEEIVANMVKLKEGLQKALIKYDSMFNLIILNLKDLGAEGNKKEFAMLVTKHNDMWHAPFFAMFDGKALNMKEFIHNNKKDGSWANSFLDKILSIANS